MRPLLDSDGENRAVRMFLLLYSGNSGLTTGKMRMHLKAAGFDGAWPEWANDDCHLTKMGAQMWLRHLFDLEQNIDTSAKHVHESDKNEHVPTLRELSEGEAAVLKRAGYSPSKFRRVLAFNDKPDQSGLYGILPGTVVKLHALDGTHVGNAVIGEKGPADAT